MIGTSLGPYKIIDQLGAGGMGEVYLGEDTRLGRKVAIKVLPAEFAGDPSRLARFEQEARAAAALNHPHIAVVHDVGAETDDDGETAHFMVQEYLEGNTLREPLKKGALPLEKALDLATEIAEGLAAAHAAGIIHRDLKPDNIFITSEGHAKVLDFGLAKLTEVVVTASPGAATSAEAATSAVGVARGGVSKSPTVLGTVAGQVMGTAGYMAPEQVEGNSDIDHRADLFAFGCVLYEMVSGSQPFSGSSVIQTLNRIVHEEPEPLAELNPELPGQLQWILRKCMAKSPDRRYQGAADLAVDLQSLSLEVETGTALPGRETDPTSLPGGGQAVSRRPVAAGAALLVVAGVALGALAVWSLLRPSSAVSGGALRLDVRLSEDPLMGRLGSSVVLSPDGSRIAFTIGDPSSAGELWIRSLDQLDGIRLVNGVGDDSPYHPFFSPDGQWLGFVTVRELKKVPVAGGRPITLAAVSTARGATWGPDDTIIFAPGTRTGLYRVPASGGDPEQLTEPDLTRGEFSHRWPHFLPDGGGVLFTASGLEGVSMDSNVELLLVDSLERRVVQPGASYGRYAPTGHLLFANSGSLFAVPFDLEKLETSGGPAPVVQGLLTDPGEAGAQYSLGGNGTLAYLAGETSDVGHPLAWVDAEGETSPLWEQRSVYASPAVSPDGRRLAVAAMRDGNMDVWVYDLEREVPSRLTFDDAMDTNPVWSADGREIFFASNRGGGFGLYRKPADGSADAEQLFGDSDRRVSPEAVSPDGSFLLYAEGDGVRNSDLRVLPLEGSSDPREFLSTGAGEVWADISPDGRWIAYTSDESGNWAVYVRPYPPAGGKWQISSELRAGHPRWSPDGGTLYYRTGAGIVAVPVQTEGVTFQPGRSELLFEARPGAFIGAWSGVNLAGNWYRSYDLAPDGRFVMFPRSSDSGGFLGTDHVTLAFNWFEELGRLVPTER